MKKTRSRKSRDTVPLNFDMTLLQFFFFFVVVATLFLFILSVSIHAFRITFIQRYHTFIHLHSPGPLSISSLPLCSVWKNLPVVPSRESNSGLPSSKPTRYQLSHAAPSYCNFIIWILIPLQFSPLDYDPIAILSTT